MIKLEFTPEQRQALHYHRFHHPHPRVQLKMEVLYLKSQGLAHTDIARLAQVATETVRNYLKEFQHGGLDALQSLNFRRQESALAHHRATLREYFAAHPPTSLPQAAAAIKNLTGLQRSCVQVSKFLQREGLRRRKVAALPAKVQVAQQAAFVAEALAPPLAEAKKGQREGFF